MNTLTVRDLMTSAVFAVLPDDDLMGLGQLMEGWRVRHAPVVDESKAVLGVVSERDLLRKTLLGNEDASLEDIERDLRRRRVQEVMSLNVETVGPEETVNAAAQRIFDGKYGCLVVVDDRTRLLGILTESDFVRYFANQRHRGPESSGRRRAWCTAGLVGFFGGVLAGHVIATSSQEGSGAERDTRGRQLSVA